MCMPRNDPKVPVSKGNAADSVAVATTGGVPGVTASLPAEDTTTFVTPNFSSL